MNGATHIDMSKAVAEFVGWTVDVNELARNAYTPDTVRVIEVADVGAHIFGKNLASLAHFCRPRMTDRRIAYQGYRWKGDRSKPKLNLPNRDVQPKPAEWGFPTDDMTQENEPMYMLIQSLKGKATIAADEMTYSTAAVMAGWVEDTYRRLPPEIIASEEIKARAQATLAGWGLHFVQDCCVPHHVEGLLLKGHSAFEGDIEDRWRQMRGNGHAEALMKDVEIDTHGLRRSLRTICESNALKSQCSPGKLGWYRCVWRRGWHKLVDATIERAVRTSIESLRWLQGAG